MTTNRIAPNSFEEALAAALRLLKQSDRLECEIYQQLQQKSFEDDTINLVIKTLQEKRLLDDHRTLNMLLEKFIQKDYSIQRISHEFSTRTVPEELIKQLLNGLSSDYEIQTTNAWLRRKFSSNDDPLKMAQFLAGKGFDEDVVYNSVSKYTTRKMWDE